VAPWRLGTDVPTQCIFPFLFLGKAPGGSGLLELELPCPMSRATLLTILRFLYTGLLPSGAIPACATYTNSPSSAALRSRARTTPFTPSCTRTVRAATAGTEEEETEDAARSGLGLTFNPANEGLGLTLNPNPACATSFTSWAALRSRARRTPSLPSGGEGGSEGGGGDGGGGEGGNEGGGGDGRGDGGGGEGGNESGDGGGGGGGGDGGGGKGGSEGGGRDGGGGEGGGGDGGCTRTARAAKAGAEEEAVEGAAPYGLPTAQEEEDGVEGAALCSGESNGLEPAVSEAVGAAPFFETGLLYDGFESAVSQARGPASSCGSQEEEVPVAEAGGPASSCGLEEEEDPVAKSGGPASGCGSGASEAYGPLDRVTGDGDSGGGEVNRAGVSLFDTGREEESPGADPAELFRLLAAADALGIEPLRQWCERLPAGLRVNP